MVHIHRGMSLREAIRVSQILGVEVCAPVRTGELRFRHHRLRQSVRVNGRRTDVPRTLVSFLRLIATAGLAADAADESMAASPRRLPSSRTVTSGREHVR